MAERKPRTMAEVPRNTLGEHSESLIADVMEKREEATIKSVCMRIEGGEPLDPQYAIQMWLAIVEGRRLRAALIRRSKLENSRIAENS